MEYVAVLHINPRILSADFFGFFLNGQVMTFELSIEFFPPQTAEGSEKLRTTLAQLAVLKPAFFSVTYGAGGSTQEGTFTTVREILAEGVSAASHFSCIGATRQSVREQLAAHHTGLSRGDLVNYAGVAGDANPIHWDETLAKLAGLPDVIAHGMLTMGLGAGYVSAWSGDPGAVTRYTVRLSQPAVVSAAEGCDIEFSGKIKSLDPETRSGVVLVGAKSNGKKIFGLATVEMRFR